MIFLAFNLYVRLSICELSMLGTWDESGIGALTSSLGSSVLSSDGLREFMSLTDCMPEKRTFGV